MPSLKVSLLSQNKPSGVGALRTGGFINNFLISLKAFSASSVHLNFLAFFCRAYIGISNLQRLGRKDDKKLTILWHHICLLVGCSKLCLPVSKILVPYKLSFCCSKGSVSMELFPARLTSPLAEYLHKLLCRMARTRGLLCRYVILCLEWAIGLVRMVYLLIVSIVVELQ